MGQQVGLLTNGRDAADRIRTEGWHHGGLRHLKLQSRKDAREAADMCATSDRLRPMVVATGRGQTVWSEILKALARLEKTDGLTLADLVRETRSQLPTSATVIALLTSVPPETAIALGNLRRRGYAVTAILIVYETHEFAQLSQPLIAQRVEVRQLANEASLPTLCSQTVLR